MMLRFEILPVFPASRGSFPGVLLAENFWCSVGGKKIDSSSHGECGREQNYNTLPLEFYSHVVS